MDYDCVIVGGGLVGISFALMLKQLNYQVLVIEKNHPPLLREEFHARTVALSYASHTILKSLKIWEHLTRTVPIQQVVVNVKGRYGSSRLDSQQQQWPALGFVVDFSELENTLLNALIQLDPTCVLRPAQMTQAIADPQGWSITVTTATATQVHSMRTRLLVAADGAMSTWRERQGIASEQTVYHHYALMSNVSLVNHTPFMALERFLTQGAIALLPWRNDYATCVWTVGANEVDRLQALNDTDFLVQCQAQLGMRVGKLLNCAPRYSVPLQMHLATQQSSHRFLLLGNAAHSLHPIAAQGLNLSLRDIWQIRQQLASTPKQDLGQAAFLDEYLTARRADQQRVIFATDKIARFMSGGPLPTSLRAMGITLFDCLTPIKNQFTRYSMGLA